jgi:thiamine-phosphate diphosphorylase
MILHLVTDRRRLAQGAADAGTLDCLFDQIRFAVAAGLDVIQIRERDLEGRRLAQLTRHVVALARGSRTRVVVNERLDVALAAGADGVHLRGSAMDASRVRASVPRAFLIGRSVRSADEARSAGPVDYLIAGTVWSTPSKPEGHELLGAEGLTRVVAASVVPVLGIGGIQLDRVRELASAGAAGMAAIGAWIGEGEGEGCRSVPLHELARTFRAAFAAANISGGFLPGNGVRQAGN